MDTELLKLLGNGGSQLILAAGYYPVYVLIRALWDARESLQSKLVEMLAMKFADAANSKDLWSAQAKVIEDQTRTIAEQSRIISMLDRRVAELAEELKRART